ncbi:MAG: DnaJ domain-containing protein [Mycoplasmataceae bacterium]|nr:DnaJ domain-containing protein [Mycoplasmataceae bacterium]
MNKNYYKILGISNNASQPEIKKAYFAKAKMYHPDVCKDKDAEQKFKLVCSAYEVLKDERRRKDYDEYISSNSNDSFKGEFASDSNSSKFNNLHEIFSLKSDNDDSFVNFVRDNFKTESEIVNAYSYFWLSFWSGGRGTIEMLKNKNAAQIFKAFCVNPFIKAIRQSLEEQIRTDENQKQQLGKMRESLRKMYNSVPEHKMNSQITYNWMIRIIRDENIFDDESSMYYFLLLSNDVINILKKFELIFDGNSQIKARGHYSNGVRAKKSGGIFSTILTFLFIFFLFRFLFGS